MKKIKFKLLLLSFLTILSGCNKSDSNINPNAQNVDYEFTITINGLSHKIKGNTVNGMPWLNTPNNCYAINSSNVSLGIKDVSASNYISGQVLGCTITLPNLALGVNNATLRFDGGYWTNLTESLGGYPGLNDLSTTSGVSVGSGSSNIPFNITDLGNAPTIYTNAPLVYNHKKTLKGNFNGILYMVSKNTFKYDIPINISIDFKAVRMN